MRARLVSICTVLFVTFAHAWESAEALEDPTLVAIRQAWADRQARVPALTAEWTYEVLPIGKDPNVPTDLDAAPKREKLFLNQNTLRFERTQRYYDIDGGPGGSMSWQTGTEIESFTTENGWRRLFGSSLPNVRSAGSVNRSPQAIFKGLDGSGLFLFWFRGLDDNFNRSSFGDWTVTTDPRFSDLEPDRVVLLQHIDVDKIRTLSLVPALGFLPVRSTRGKWPGPDQPYSNYTECRVTLTPTNDPELPVRPVMWTIQDFRNGQPAKRPHVAVLENLQYLTTVTETSLEIEFPEGVKPGDASRSGMIASTTPQSLTPPVFGSTSKHPMHWGYWIAMVFGGCLLIMLIRSAWRRSRSCE